MISNYVHCHYKCCAIKGFRMIQIHLSQQVPNVEDVILVNTGTSLKATFHHSHFSTCLPISKAFPSVEPIQWSDHCRVRWRMPGVCKVARGR